MTEDKHQIGKYRSGMVDRINIPKVTRILQPEECKKGRYEMGPAQRVED